jgi:hypothetical protein
MYDVLDLTLRRVRQEQGMDGGLRVVGEGFDCGIRVGYLPASFPVRVDRSARASTQAPAYVPENGEPKGPADILKHSAITPGTDRWTFTRDDQSAFPIRASSDWAEHWTDLDLA